jgi:hypothetical protein
VYRGLQLTEAGWRSRWEAERWFVKAGGESGKQCKNETIRVTPDGEVSIKIPSALVDLANAPHGRYVLACRAGFRHRCSPWSQSSSSSSPRSA